MPPREPRGPYQKGIEMRERIIDAALSAYAASDSRGPAIRAIAETVGLTDKGLSYHFASRDELLLAVLQERDRLDMVQPDVDDPAFLVHLVETVSSRNIGKPGLVKLYLDMAVAASDPSHVAHDFFVERYELLRTQLARLLMRRGATEEGADWGAVAILAAADGLQVQWLLNPSIDMPKIAVLVAQTIEANLELPVLGQTLTS